MDELKCCNVKERKEGVSESVHNGGANTQHGYIARCAGSVWTYSCRAAMDKDWSVETQVLLAEKNMSNLEDE